MTQASAAPSWIQVLGRAAPDHVEHLEEALFAAGALTLTLTDQDDTRQTAILEPAIGTHPHWPNTVVTGLFPHDADDAAIIAAVRAALGESVALHVERLEDRDWVRAWMDDYQPMRFGERLWICPADMQVPADAGSDAVVVRLDPGLAFGTGTHPTTAMCLRWLDKQADAAAGAAALDTTLDYGCGSGVLAIAAARLGAARVAATDIDPQALDATRSNARHNNVSVTVTDVSSVTGSYGVVLANILAGPLAELAPTLLAHLKPGGHLVLAGLLDDQTDAVRAAYAGTVDLQVTDQQGDWVLLTGRRAQPDS